MKPILQTEIEKFQNMRLEFYNVETTIVMRLDDIIHSIASTCQFDFADWHTHDCSEGYASACLILANPYVKKEYRKMRDFLDMSQIEYEGFHEYVNYNPIIIIDGKELNVLEKLPARWLYENFTKELAEGHRLAMEKIAAKRRASEKAIKTIKSRLTKKEIKLLNL